MNTYRTPARLHVTHTLMHRQKVTASIDCVYYCRDGKAWLQATLPVLNFVVSALWDEDSAWELEVDGVRYPLDLREETLRINGGQLDLMLCGVEDLIVLYSEAVA